MTFQKTLRFQHNLTSSKLTSTKQFCSRNLKQSLIHSKNTTKYTISNHSISIIISHQLKINYQKKQNYNQIKIRSRQCKCTCLWRRRHSHDHRKEIKGHRVLGPSLTENRFPGTRNRINDGSISHSRCFRKE